jgi:hypothetical protein
MTRHHMHQPVNAMPHPVGYRRVKSSSLVTHPILHLSSCRLTWSPNLSTSFCLLSFNMPLLVFVPWNVRKYCDDGFSRFSELCLCLYYSGVDILLSKIYYWFFDKSVPAAWCFGQYLSLGISSGGPIQCSVLPLLPYPVDITADILTYCCSLLKSAVFYPFCLNVSRKRNS